MVGQTLGKYRVIDRIGRGGMGTVYRAIDETLHRDVAIKILNAELNDPEVAKRFRAEAITVARLSHPGIATVHELFEHDGHWMMVMEFVRGETVEALLDKFGSLSAERAAEICMLALTALAHAHHLGVVHRDLKPANLMITDSGVVKVMDFGIARVSGTEHLTGGGYTMGTPAYMSPEQVLGHKIDARADLYAMGVVFYRLVTGKLPFSGDSPFALAQSQVNDPPTPISNIRANLPPWVEQVVTRALAKKPEERFQSASAFHDALTGCLTGRQSIVTYDPAAPTEIMVTPAFAMPAATLQPSTGALPVTTGGDTIPLGTPNVAAKAAAKSFARSNQLVLMIAGAIVVLTVGAAWLWSRIGRAPENPPAANTTLTTAPPPVSPQPPPAPISTPNAAPANAKPTTPVTNAASKGRSANPVTGAASPSPSTKSAAAPGPATSELHMIPGLVWFSTGADAKVQERNIALTLAGGNVSVAPAEGGKALMQMPLANIKKATFVHAKDPMFDQALAKLPTGAAIHNRLERNWLVLQSQTEFIVIRLESSTERVLATFEALGTKVVRATPAR